MAAASPVVPLAKRLASSDWKTRASAYEDLKQQIVSSNQPASLLKYAPMMKKIIGDIAPLAQDVGMQTVIAFIDRVPHPIEVGLDIVSTIIQTALTSARAGKKATEALLLYFEVYEDPLPILTELIKGGNNKTPKISAACITVISLAIQEYGLNIFANETRSCPQLLLDTLPSWFDHSVVDVRNAAMNLASWLYRWMGQDLLPHLSSLRSAQTKSLLEAIEGINAQVKPTPNKTIRSRTANNLPPPSSLSFSDASLDVDVSEGELQSSGNLEAHPMEDEGFALDNSWNEDVKTYSNDDDEFSKLPSVNILHQIHNDWYKKLGDPDWQIRMNQLEWLANLIDAAPRLESGNYSKLISSIHKLLSDPKTPVVTIVVKLMGLFALKLRKEFFPFAKKLCPIYLDRFKEKKSALSAQLTMTLDQFYSNCFLLGDIVDEITASLNNKVPKVREETWFWVARCIARTPASIVNENTEWLCGLIVKMTSDSIQEVRQAVSHTFQELVNKVGEQNIQPFIAGSKLESRLKLFSKGTSAPSTPSSTPNKKQSTTSTPISTPLISPSTTPTIPAPNTPSAYALSTSPPSVLTPSLSTSTPTPVGSINKTNSSSRLRTVQTKPTPFSPPSSRRSRSNTFSGTKKEGDDISDNSTAEDLIPLTPVSSLPSPTVVATSPVSDGDQSGVSVIKSWERFRDSLSQQLVLFDAGLKASLNEMALSHQTDISLLKRKQSQGLAIEELKKLSLEDLDVIEKQLEHQLINLRVVKQEKLQQQLESIQKSNACTICHKNQKTSVLLPCRHRAVCRDCGIACTQCPICAAAVVDRIDIQD